MNRHVSGLRFWAVMGTTMAAIIGVDLAIGAAHPYLALAVTVAILAVSNVALPSLMWLRVMRFCRWSARMLRSCRTPPESPVAGVLGMSSVRPGRRWLRFTDFCRWIPWALDSKGMKPHRVVVIVSLGVTAEIIVDALVMPAHLTAGLVLCGVIIAACGLAVWRPGRDTIRQWRDERIEEKCLYRQLTQTGTHDDEDFNGKGIPRKEWAAFNEALAGVLEEMRASGEREQ